MFSFPVHVFFDDAYELCDGDDEEYVVNRFVKQLVQIMDTAARLVIYHFLLFKVVPQSFNFTQLG